MSLYVNNLVCNSSTIAGGTCLTDTSTNTLSNKTIDTASNVLSVASVPIQNIISGANPVLVTSSPVFNSISTNYAAVLGNLPTLTRAVNSVYDGLDSSSNPHLQLATTPTSGLSYIDFVQSNNTEPYRGRIVYSMVDDTFRIYTSAGISPVIVINPSYLLSSSLRASTIYDSIGGNTAQINGDVATNQSIVQTLSNKTIDTASNTLTVTNSTLSAANINTILNQPLLTNSAVSFANVTASQTTNPYMIISDGSSRNGLIGVSSNANAWFSGAATGDLCISNRTLGAIRLGFNTGSSAATWIMSTSQISQVLPLVSTSTGQYTNIGVGAAAASTGSSTSITMAGYFESTGTVSVVGGSSPVIGTGGSVTISGTVISSTLTVVTGTSISTTGTVATITLSIPAPDTGYNVMINNKSLNAALYTGRLYQSNISTTQYTISNAVTNLSPSTTYIFSLTLFS